MSKDEEPRARFVYQNPTHKLIVRKARGRRRAARVRRGSDDALQHAFAVGVSGAPRRSCGRAALVCGSNYARARRGSARQRRAISCTVRHGVVLLGLAALCIV